MIKRKCIVLYISWETFINIYAKFHCEISYETKVIQNCRVNSRSGLLCAASISFVRGSIRDFSTKNCFANWRFPWSILSAVFSSILSPLEVNPWEFDALSIINVIPLERIFINGELLPVLGWKASFLSPLLLSTFIDRNLQSAYFGNIRDGL